MAARVLNRFRSEGPRHRAPGKVRKDPQPIQSAPKHCAGQGTGGCLHRHPGEPLLPVWGAS